MTSPSPTRPRTTRRRSIREPFAGIVLACGATVGLILSTATPAAAAWRDLQRTDPPPAVVAPAGFEPEVSVVVPVADETASAGVVPTAAPGDATEGGASEPTDQEAADCRAALEKLRSDTLTAIELDIRVDGRPGSDYPHECRLEGESFEPRRFATTTFTWKAAGYCHKPLYFEHWNLERYGHSHGFVADSFLSAAHFFGRLPALPYQMGVELPWECVYPLGYYRPGSCAPWTVPAVPVSARGLAVGAATATGIVFLLP